MFDAFDNIPIDPREWRSRPNDSPLRRAISVRDVRRRLEDLVKKAIIHALNGELALEEVPEFIQKWMKHEI